MTVTVYILYNTLCKVGVSCIWREGFRMGKEEDTKAKK